MLWGGSHRVLARAGKFVFGLGALVTGGVALYDIIQHGHLSLMSPYVLGRGRARRHRSASGRLAGRARPRIARWRAAQPNCSTLTAKLEASLATVSAMNARLHESEARYKGLVDAQGDAIFRRAPDSRLTYGNDAFFRLFGLRPARRARPSLRARTASRQPRAVCSAASPAWRRARRASRYDQHVRTAYGWRWIAWEDYAVRDAARPADRSAKRRPRHHRAQGAGRRADRSARQRRSGEPRQVRLPRHHEPRDPHADERRARHGAAAAGNRARPRTAHLCRGDPAIRRVAAVADRRHSGFLQDRIRHDDVWKKTKWTCAASSKAWSNCWRRAPTPRASSSLPSSPPTCPRSFAPTRMRLRQILTNLVGNAVKFTEKGGVCVDVQSAEMRGRRILRFEVRDTGVGVPREKRAGDLRRIRAGRFQPCAQLRRHRAWALRSPSALSRRWAARSASMRRRAAAACSGSRCRRIVVRDAQRRRSHQPRRASKIAIVTRNAVLREGLTAQIRAAGGEVVAARLRRRRCSRDDARCRPDRRRHRATAGTARMARRARCAPSCCSRLARAASSPELKAHGLRRLSGEAGAPALAGRTHLLAETAGMTHVRVAGALPQSSESSRACVSTAAAAAACARRYDAAPDCTSFSPRTIPSTRC